MLRKITFTNGKTEVSGLKMRPEAKNRLKFPSYRYEGKKSTSYGKKVMKPNFLSIHRFDQKRDKTVIFCLYTGMQAIFGCFVTFLARWGDFWEKGLRQPLSIASGKWLTKPDFLSIHRFCQKCDKTAIFCHHTGMVAILACFWLLDAFLVQKPQLYY